MFATQPEYSALIGLAKNGLHIPQPSNFINDTNHDHFRKNFMPTVYELHAYQLYQKSL